MTKVNIGKKFALFDEVWTPKIVAELNGQHIKLAKLKGEFDWHSHAEEDEMFLVHQGVLSIEFRDRVEIIREGELFVVPRGVEHRPVANELVEVILFEPTSTVNTGVERTEKTCKILEWI